MNKAKVLIPVMAVAMVAGSLFMTTSRAEAEGNSTGPQSLIARIAQKFNLKESDVKAVFDEERTARQAEHRQAVEDKLSQAVTAGTITEAQKSAIVAKLSEMQANRPDPGSMRSKTVEEREAEREKRRSDMDKWLQANGLSEETMRSLVGGRGGRGFGGPGMGDEASE